VGIFDRLGDVIKSYLNNEDGRIFGQSLRGDPDIEEAEAELESFLRGEEFQTRSRTNSWTRFGSKTGDWGDDRRNSGDAWRAWTDNRAGGETGNRTRRRAPEGPPETLRPDFEELGLPFGAGAEECKAAYRRLLKLHHPDRHAGHQGNMEKATKKMAKINAAYDRIEKWRTGKD
jgi:DnaJ-domain-containing protein 1